MHIELLDTLGCPTHIEAFHFVMCFFTFTRLAIFPTQA